MTGRVLVTGAAGFVGGHLLPAITAQLPDAVVIPLTQQDCDITDAAAVEALIARTAPDACIHLAAIAAIPAARRDPALAWRVNLDGTLHLARALAVHCPKARLLFISSADIYGASFRAGLPLDETAVLAPRNTYAATKAAADLALGAMAAESGLRVVRLRPFNHTGPGQSAEYVLSAFARQVVRIKAGLQAPVMRTGDLAAERDFLDVRDVCAAYASALTADLPSGTILNLASGTTRPVGAVLETLLRLEGVEARIERAAELLRPSDIPRAIGDAGLARARLAWAPAIPWEQTLRDLLASWRGREAQGL
jgi:nucleoside-diphosphate-sugar epimerase